MLLAFVRLWLPALICLAGVLVIAVGGGDGNALEGGAYIISAGLSVFLLNWLYRLSVSGDRERATEDEAREYFDRYGRWPDET